MTSTETQILNLDAACRALFEGSDESLCREARRFVCRTDAATEAVDRIVEAGRRDDWTDEQEEAAYRFAQEAVFEGDGWPRSLEEHEALMAEGGR